MRSYIPVRELAKILKFEVVGKLKRMPDEQYGFGCHYPCYMDEAGNEYYPAEINSVSCGCIVDVDGGVH